MKLLRYGIAALAMLPMLASCNEDNPWQGSATEGGLVVTVNADPSVRDAIPTRSVALTPNPEDFGIKLTKTDGTYSNQWNRLSDFPADKGFRSGEYLLEAFYGAEDDEGYKKPYYHGAKKISITPGEVTETSVSAALANTMVSVTYTDAFKNYFTSYEATLHSKGYGYHAIDPASDEAVYLHPGEITVTVDFTKQNGKSATIQPAEFTAEARHHYHITLDVNDGQIGDAQLVVKFDDTVVEEDVEIDLSDELLDVNAPEVNPTGFTTGQILKALEMTAWSETPKFNVYAAGYIVGASLTIESDTWTPEFGREIDLVGATPTEQQQVADAGIRVIGLFKNPEKMASIDLSGVATKLPVGTHKFTLVVKDKLTRVNEPVDVTIVTSPLEIALASTSPAVFGSTTGHITVTYNGKDPQGNITVQGLADNGNWVDCPVTAVSTSSSKARRTRSADFPAVNYDLTLTIPNTTRDLDIRLFYQGRQVATGTIQRLAPDYSLAVNAFATRAIITVNPAQAQYLQTITENLRLFENGSEIASNRISRDTQNGTVTVTGLTAATTYTLPTTAMRGSNPTMGASAVFTTEAAAQPENGNMDSWSSIKKYKGSILGVGGNEDVLEWFANSTGSASYWDSHNVMTTSQTAGSTHRYTSYSGTLPITNGSGYAAQISTLGYGKDTTWVLGPGYIVKKRTAGMLFMGSCTVDGVETYGRPFTSRPSSFSFDYMFAPYNGESCKAYAVIEHRDGSNVTRLAYGEFVTGDTQSSYATKTVNLTYTNTALKATHAYIVFVSSTAESPATKPVQGSKGAFVGYWDSMHVGCVLTVDNIKFNY